MLQIEVKYVRREEAKRSDQCSTNIDIQHLGQHQFTQLRRKKTGLDVPAKDHTGSVCLSGDLYRYLILYTYMFDGKRQQGCKHLAAGEISELETQQLFYHHVFRSWDNIS